MVNDGTTPPPPGATPPGATPPGATPPGATPPGQTHTPSGPYGGPRTGFSGRGTRFFDWMRGLGVTRTDGWIGGVCAGIAYRIGIDPLIVRGIVGVAALLGAPVVLLYAIAWALLPDRDGRIHLQRLFEGEFEAPIVAIGVLIVLSLLPWSNGIWWFGGPFGHDPGWFDVVGRVFWTLIVLGAAAALIVVAVRNADRRSGGNAGAPAPSAGAAPSTTNVSPTTNASASPASPVSPAATAPASAAAAAPAAPAVAIASEPAAPPAPGAGASEQEVADWRDRQAQWRAEHEQWKQRLAEDMRAVKAQRSAELKAQASAANAEAEARRASYRAANPRVGAAIGWLAVGLALVAASLTGAFWGALTGLPGYALTASLASATLVFGVTVLIAGIARRRSGFLIFLGILLAALTAVAALLPTSPGVRLDASVSSRSQLSVAPSGSANYLQAWGDTTIDLSRAVRSSRAPVVNLAKGPGETTVVVPDDATIRLEAATVSSVTVIDPAGGRQVHHCDPAFLGGCDTDLVVGPAATPQVVVRIAQVDGVRVERVQK
ncbi:PspC domain-containing protein [Leifsonia shinshuensis]|uniref:PspC domain-containing protein n=1 Tax=Leifsonia shinshuensis TaxID=150026 RepID=UPI001F5083A5|nr:PspC domain-containing protein [Leifsonia shinshuensis]MCI0157466.1 PspC domain-containing protein [Leifsonia shinshuensis]